MGLRAVAVVLLLVAVTGCGDGTATTAVAGAGESEPTPSAGAGAADPVVDQETVPRCGPGVAKEPCGAGLQEGRRYPYLVQTHCGVKGIYADGREWVPAAGQDGGENGAPVGFEDPEDLGSVVLLNDQQLDYRSAAGVPLRFVPGEIPDEECN